MCTASIVAYDGGVRLVCNRDERRSRADALPPAPRQSASGAVIYPLDPCSAGTWIGVGGRGFAAVLLNRTPARRRGYARPAATSRGGIVPLVLGCSSFVAASHAAARLDCREYEPFALVLVTPSQAFEFTSGHTSCACRSYALDTPLVFTSSSLGDALVEAPRRALFDRMVRHAADPLAGQQRFHRHQWPLARDISVRMERDDAATVSRTTIDLSARGLRVVYERIGSGEARGASRAA